MIAVKEAKLINKILPSCLLACWLLGDNIRCNALSSPFQSVREGTDYSVSQFRFSSYSVIWAATW